MMADGLKSCIMRWQTLSARESAHPEGCVAEAQLEAGFGIDAADMPH